MVATCELSHCNLDSYPLNNLRCILHDTDPHKDPDKFQAVLADEISRQEEDSELTVIELQSTTFLPQTDFTNRVFRKSINMNFSHFLRDANFTNAKFEDTVFGVNILVNGDADFQGASFERSVVFRQMKVSGRLNCSDTSWGAEAEFSSASFAGGVNFSSAKFNDRVNFSFATFNTAASFFNSCFSGDANFTLATFDSDAYFARATFSGETRFNSTRFSDETNFRDADLSKASQVDFSSVSVGTSLDFSRTQFPTENHGPNVAFRYLESDSSAKVRFESVSLIRVSFLYSDISPLQFVGCTWPKISGRNAVYDEIALYDPKEIHEVVLEPQLIADQYRQLRLNLEASKQEVEAGDFYIRQMEMRRRGSDSFSMVYRFLLFGYRSVAMYGESYVRPVLLIFAIAPVFGLLYILGGFYVPDGTSVREIKYELGWPPSVGVLQDYFRANVHALTAGGFLGTKLVTPSWWVTGIRFLNMLFDTLLLAAFIIAIRRNFHR